MRQAGHKPGQIPPIRGAQVGRGNAKTRAQVQVLPPIQCPMSSDKRGFLFRAGKRLPREEQPGRSKSIPGLTPRPTF